jgi:hypothetical protein
MRARSIVQTIDEIRGSIIVRQTNRPKSWESWEDGAAKALSHNKASAPAKRDSFFLADSDDELPVQFDRGTDRENRRLGEEAIRIAKAMDMAGLNGGPTDAADRCL